MLHRSRLVSLQGRVSCLLASGCPSQVTSQSLSCLSLRIPTTSEDATFEVSEKLAIWEKSFGGRFNKRLVLGGHEERTNRRVLLNSWYVNILLVEVTPSFRLVAIESFTSILPSPLRLTSGYINIFE